MSATQPDHMHATPPYVRDHYGHVRDLYGAVVLYCGPWAGCPARYSERAVEDDPHFVCPSCGRHGNSMENATPEACGLDPLGAC
jgi:hypothetical protein